MKKKTFCSGALRLSSLSGILTNDPLETVIPDGIGRRILLSIQETMRQLAPVGDNDRRTLWFEVLGRGKNPEVMWLEVSFSIYRDFHYMLLSDGRSEYHAVMNRSDSADEPAAGYGTEGLTRSLSCLFGYLQDLIRKIAADPQAYNKYLEDNFPWALRTGGINVQELDRIFGRRIVDAEERAVVQIIPGDLSRFSSRSFPVLSMDDLPSDATPEQLDAFVRCVTWDPVAEVRCDPWRFYDVDGC
ncbi:MAG: hypothetical protein IJR77_04530 [Bacteroidales bacterium]|nr:hypothetical protein [Bacteroidales bacterium]